MPGRPPRTPRGSTENLGASLYADAQRKLKRQREAIGQRAQAMQDAELKEATFSPAIASSQRRCPGSARASTPEGAAREQRRWLKQRADRAAEKQRKQRDDASDECTFTPRICEKSVDMVASRLQRLRITGNLYDHLYADAMRRQDRMVEAEQWLPKEATFSPEIGLEHYRPSPDADRAALRERLSSSRGHLWSARAPAKADDSGLFTPRIGRPPTVARNASQKPIGEFLHEMAKETEKRRRQSEKENADSLRKSADNLKVEDKSLSLMEMAKKRTYRELFAQLGGRDGVLRYETVNRTAYSETGGADELQSDPLFPYVQPILLGCKKSRSSSASSSSASVSTLKLWRATRRTRIYSSGADRPAGRQYVSRRESRSRRSLRGSTSTRKASRRRGAPGSRCMKRYGLHKTKSTSALTLRERDRNRLRSRNARSSPTHRRRRPEEHLAAEHRADRRPRERRVAKGLPRPGTVTRRRPASGPLRGRPVARACSSCRRRSGDFSRHATPCTVLAMRSSEPIVRSASRSSWRLRVLVSRRLYHRAPLRCVHRLDRPGFKPPVHYRTFPPPDP
jgi:hypothetical protein